MKLLFSLILLTSCATREIVHSDGKPAFIAKCDATMLACYREAGDRCAAGYEIMEENKMGAANATSAKTLVGFVYRCK